MHEEKSTTQPGRDGAEPPAPEEYDPQQAGQGVDEEQARVWTKRLTTW